MQDFQTMFRMDGRVALVTLPLPLQHADHLPQALGHVEGDRLSTHLVKACSNGGMRLFAQIMALCPSGLTEMQK